MLKILPLIVLVLILTVNSAQAANMKINSEAKSFRHSTTIEKERPQLDDVTRKLIADYQKNPTEANKQALRNQIGINYDKVIAQKKAKAVKGGSWDSSRTDCRTEERTEGRNINNGYDNVGFRIVRER